MMILDSGLLFWASLYVYRLMKIARVWGSNYVYDVTQLQ